MTTDTLLPCPFCGSAGEWLECGKGGSWAPLAVCSNPFCQARIVGGGANRDLMRKDATAKWNARAHDADKARIAVLEGALREAVQRWTERADRHRKSEDDYSFGIYQTLESCAEEMAALTTQASEVK